MRKLTFTILIGLLSLSGKAFACEEELIAAQLDLSKLTSSELGRWDEVKLRALRLRLETEIPATVSQNGAAKGRISRFVDLSLSAEGLLKVPYDDGALASLGIKRRTSFRHEWESDIKERTPVAPSRDFLIIDSAYSLELILDWMKKGQLISRFERWNIYKLRFVFPNPRGPKGVLKIDFVPCYLTPEKEFPQLWVSHNGPNFSELDIRDIHESFEQAERYIPLYLFDSYRESAVRKMTELGHDYLFATYPEDDEIKRMLDAVTVLKHLGYEVEPFAPADGFWRKRTDREASPVIIRGLAALKHLAENQMLLVPISMIPKEEKKTLVERIRLTRYKHDQTLAENYVRTVLSFSGAMTKERFIELYSNDPKQWKYFTNLKVLDDVADIVNPFIEQVLQRAGVNDEIEITRWQEDNWEAINFIRAIHYMQENGYRFDLDSGRWIHKNDQTVGGN